MLAKALQTHRTLLLTRGYQPLTVISWKRAIRLQILDKVEVVETYDREVRSVRLVLKLPSVVRLVGALALRPKHVKFSRENVLARDRWRCQYCGDHKPTPQLTLDHVIPRSRGGPTNWQNIVTACKDCNHHKANRTPREAHMRLRKKPKQPHYLAFLAFLLTRQRSPQIWTVYCQHLRPR
ncbi:MAG: HNH endonuclease [Deltaproteobacteria bacterium]|nr:HNH endonuclease [Deltaproteobacteria bacterium]